MLSVLLVIYSTAYFSVAYFDFCALLYLTMCKALAFIPCHMFCLRPVFCIHLLINNNTTYCLSYQC